MDRSDLEDLRALLTERALRYEGPDFIADDPIQIPHGFEKREDIEISGLLTAVISWGKREMIIKNATRMMELMGNAPHDFVMEHKASDLDALDSFVHRTFQGEDLRFFISALRGIYSEYGTLEELFRPLDEECNLGGGIIRFRQRLLKQPHRQRSEKHLANPAKGSAAKRLMMYLRWMVRSSKGGVDFGLWNKISPALLSCPLDVHSGRVARHLGLLQRKQNDWKAVEELDVSLRLLDSEDPARFDYALFGMGVYENLE